MLRYVIQGVPDSDCPYVEIYPDWPFALVRLGRDYLLLEDLKGSRTIRKGSKAPFLNNEPPCGIIPPKDIRQFTISESNHYSHLVCIETTCLASGCTAKMHCLALSCRRNYPRSIHSTSGCWERKMRAASSKGPAQVRNQVADPNGRTYQQYP